MGKFKRANNVPKQTDTSGYGGDTPQVTSNGQVYYANTAIGDFIDKAIGIFGLNPSETTSAEANVATKDGTGIPTHGGWVIRKVGVGHQSQVSQQMPIAKGVNSFVKIFTGGGGKGGSGQLAANAEIKVNSTGFIQEITIGNTADYMLTHLLPMYILIHTLNKILCANR